MNGETITVTTAVVFKRWSPPNYALIAPPPGSRSVETGSYAIKELDTAALDALAQAWLEDLYAKAGRPSPFRLATVPGIEQP